MIRHPPRPTLFPSTPLSQSGLEQVGGHAGAVADVVPHVVGDHGGVAGVVLGDRPLDLADQVGPDIGRLGEDAPADPDRKSTRLNSSHANISYAVFCLKKKKT